MPSTVYAISIWHGLSRLSKGMEQCERQIVKIRAEESGHLYNHHLSRDLVIGTRQRHYLVTVLDACTRLARDDVLRNIKSINFFHARYSLRFEDQTTDHTRSKWLHASHHYRGRLPHTGAGSLVRRMMEGRVLMGHTGFDRWAEGGGRDCAGRPLGHAIRR